jgi:hypothetical protein
MNENTGTSPAKGVEHRLGRRFSRAGWLGFLLQIALGAVPVVLGSWFYFVSPNATTASGGVTLVSLLAMAVLVILLVTTILFFSYTRIGKGLATGASKWKRPGLRKLVGFGLLLGGFSVFASSIVMIAEVSSMLLTFLEFPQGGVPVIQTTANDATWISALDVLSLLALSLSITAEIIVIGLGFWLLSGLTKLQASPASTATAQPAMDDGMAAAPAG